MAAGDFFNNMWLKVKSYAFPHMPHLKTVRDLQKFVTNIDAFNVAHEENDTQEAFNRISDEFWDLREYCKNNVQAILEIFPTLKDPLDTFNLQNPFYTDDLFEDSENLDWALKEVKRCLQDDWIEFDTDQNYTFLEHLSNALDF